MPKRTHLVVGAGRMGGALLSGWLSNEPRVLKPDNLIVLDPNPGDAARKAIKNGARQVDAPDRSMSNVECMLLAIKPQMFDALAPSIAEMLPKGALVISILAGTSMDDLCRIFPNQAIVRAMPNTPAAIGAGITAFTCDKTVTNAQKTHTKMLLSAGGKVHAVANEHLIDIVTAVSGSGPAYVFHLVEALQKAAMRAGLPEDIAPDFARQTVIGAGALLAASPMTASELREAVTSPGGTTQAALEELMPQLPRLMEKTVKAALARAKELGS